MTATLDPNNKIAPDPESIEAFSKVLFDYCEGWVAVREFPEKGGAGQVLRTPFFRADANLARNIVSEAQRAAASGLALYVVPGTVSAQGKAKADDVVATEGPLLDLPSDHASPSRLLRWSDSNSGMRACACSPARVTIGPTDIH
jgi:putative DNA primase/helicase